MSSHINQIKSEQEPLLKVS